MSVNRLKELDGLRGIAALVVVVYHYFYRYDQIYGHSFDVPYAFKYGYFGVHLFFIISGFVIYWTISRCDKPLDFVWSRFSRLYPTFWCALIVTFSAVSFFGLSGRESSVHEFLMNFLMFHELLKIGHVDGVYWTLTLELSFYFWLLVLFIFGWVKHVEKLAILGIVGAAVLTSPEIAGYVPFTYRKFLLLDFMELFAIGICFYKYWSSTQSVWTHGLFAASLLTIGLDYPLDEIIVIGMIIMGFVALVRGHLSFLQHKVFVYFGALSYALYLLHQNIGYIIINASYQLGLPAFVGIVGAGATSIVLAHALVVYIERPSISALRRFYKDSARVQGLRKKLSLR